MINELDGIELNCTCEMPTIVVNHVDLPGRVAEVTTMLSMLSINIATMSASSFLIASGLRPGFASCHPAPDKGSAGDFSWRRHPWEFQKRN